jgi:protein TonB
MLPRLAIVLALHVLALFAFVSHDRSERPRTPQTVMLLTLVAPKIAEPLPPPPPPPPRPRNRPQPAGREAAAPTPRDIDVVPRTEVAATIVDNAVPVEPAGGRPDGDVILAVLINVDGWVTDARVARSSGEPILDRTALASARKCRFVAATVDKVPVPSWEPFRFSWVNR